MPLMEPGLPSFIEPAVLVDESGRVILSEESLEAIRLLIWGVVTRAAAGQKSWDA